MFMMMIMPISPSSKWEMYVNSKETSDKFIESHTLKIRKMSHIMQLNKKSNYIKSMYSPSNKLLAMRYQDN
jgi:hypothetical protein